VSKPLRQLGHFHARSSGFSNHCCYVLQANDPQPNRRGQKDVCLAAFDYINVLRIKIINMRFLSYQLGLSHRIDEDQVAAPKKWLLPTYLQTGMSNLPSCTAACGLARNLAKQDQVDGLLKKRL
jgi:hypothetical protein